MGRHQLATTATLWRAADIHYRANLRGFQRRQAAAQVKGVARPFLPFQRRDTSAEQDTAGAGFQLGGAEG